MSVLRRCPGCSSWYDKNDGSCSMCGEPPAKFNKWLRTAQLNSQLYDMANRSVTDDQKVGRA